MMNRHPQATGRNPPNKKKPDQPDSGRNPPSGTTAVPPGGSVQGGRNPPNTNLDNLATGGRNPPASTPRKN
jgi:hypothetical protein